MRLPNCVLALCVLATTVIPFSSSFAGSSAVTLIFSAGVIRDQNQNPAQAGAIGVLVADTTGAGFASGAALAGSTLSANNTLGASNDLIVATFPVQVIPLTPGQPTNPQTDTQFSSNISIPDTVAQGKKLALYWFPSITAAGTTLTTGMYYGYYRSDIVDSLSGSDAGISYSVPAAGSWNLATWDKIALNDPTALATQANLSALQVIAAIPEPSTVALLGGGLFAMGAWLRRRKAA